jgi:hypothetical protein
MSIRERSRRSGQKKKEISFDQAQESMLAQGDVPCDVFWVNVPVCLGNNSERNEQQ